MLQLTTVEPSALAANPAHKRLQSIIGRLTSVAEALFDQRRWAENFIAARYSGWGWNDTTERKINADVANCNWTRF
jgi:hypothetical protein